MKTPLKILAGLLALTVVTGCAKLPLDNEAPAAPVREMSRPYCENGNGPNGTEIIGLLLLSKSSWTKASLSE